MKYNSERSLCYNLAKKLGLAEERFRYFGVTEIIKIKPTIMSNGHFWAYDIVLGEDGDTIAIVSLQHYTTNMSFIRNNMLVKENRGVMDIMVSVTTLSDLNKSFDDVVSEGIDSAWVAANAVYFNTEDNPAAVYEAAVYIREAIKGE